MRKVAVQTTAEHLCPGLKAFANICKAAHMAKITRILSATSRCFLGGIANIAKEKNYNVTKGKKARKDCKYGKNRKDLVYNAKLLCSKNRNYRRSSKFSKRKH